MFYSSMQLADAFIKAGELNDALDALNEHILNAPDDHDARRLRAQVLLRLGDSHHLVQAVSDLQTITRTPGDDYTLSVIYEKLADDKALPVAFSAYEKSTDARHRARALERVLNLLQKRGDHQRALTLALEEGWLQWAADAAGALHDDALAVQYYTQALERVSKLDEQVPNTITQNIRARVLLKRASIYHRLEKLTEADEDYLAAEAIIPDDVMIGFNRGLIAALKGQRESSIELVHHALQSAPSGLRNVMQQALASDERYSFLRPDNEQ